MPRASTIAQADIARTLLARPSLSALPSVQAALREIARLMARQMAEEDAKKT